MTSKSLEDITFLVVKKEVYTFLENGKQLEIPGKIALINSANDNPLSIVSKNYEVITNQEAYDYGITCMKTLFGFNEVQDIKLFNIISPNNLSFCHIDLIKDSYSFTVLGERYLPFIRITNSYNSSFKLSFKIGVCRSICTNGMIFGGDTIEFKYNHVKGAKKELNFVIKKDEFSKIINKFKSDVQILKDTEPVNNNSFLIFCKALGFTFDINNTDQKKKNKAKEKLNNYYSQFHPILNKYVFELGNNYYALYNVITEIGTNGFTDDGSPVLRINSWQRRAGLWLNEFCDLLRVGNIDYQEYLKDYLELRKN